MFLKASRKVQNGKGFMIIKTRIDYGGEFKNDQFENFSNARCIVHKFSTSRTLQNNRVVERE